MKRVLSLLIVLISLNSLAQITGTGIACLTNYTNGAQNDTIYYYPQPQLGELTATPANGTGPFDFVWAKFTAATGAWTAYTTQNNLPSSTIIDLLPGAYYVTIIDANGNVVGCDVAWIGQFLNGTSTNGNIVADIFPIPPSCTSINIDAQINYTPGTGTPGYITGYSNLPPIPMLIDAQTAISVCFTATHTWVSDIGFYLVGPPSCGSPTIILSPNPGSLGQVATCNSGNNVSNLCFSTESLTNMNMCVATTPLTGTYGSYGPASTPIGWSTLYGCDATAPGWSVQIYDCVGGDVGALTDATIVIGGTNACGGSQTMSYSTPPGYSSFIADNSCSSTSASIFTVPPGNNYTPITCTYGFEWSNSLGAYMDDALVSLLGASFPINLSLDDVILWTDSTMTSAYPLQNVTFYLEPHIDCNGTQDGDGCFGGGGGNDFVGDSEPFVYIEPTTVEIPPIGPFCIFDGVIQLPVLPVAGQWSGPGIEDPIAGTFNVDAVGPGFHVLSFTPDDPCIYSNSVTASVGMYQELFIQDPGPLCVNQSPISLFPSWGGFYSGNGITDPFQGIFDPADAGVGMHLVEVSTNALCGAGGSVMIEVNPAPILNVTLDSDVCYDLPTNLNATGADSYEWSPATFLDDPLSATPVSTPTTDIIYFVTGSNAFGCSSDGSVALTVIALPEIFITSPQPSICAGESTDLTSTGTAGGYNWTIQTGQSVGSSTNLTVSPVVTTDYTVTVTDGCGLTASDNMTVTVFPFETLSIGNDMVICDGDDVALIATTSANNADFTWVSIDGTVPAQSQNNSSITVSTSGTYQVQMITQEQCYYEDEVNVTISQHPVLSVSPDAEICNNQPYQLSASGALSYEWSPASALNNTGIANPVATVAQPTVVTVTGSNMYGCETTETISLTVIAPPSVTADDLSPVCIGSVVALTATGTDGDFQWTPSAGVQNAFSANASATPLVTTTYTVSLTDECGVVATDQVTAVVENSVVIDAGADQSYCAGESVELTALITGTYASLAWSSADGYVDPSQANQLSLGNVLEGDYVVTVTTALSCEYADLVSVSEIPLPNVFIPSPVEFCPGESVVLNAGNNWDAVVWNNSIFSVQLEVSNSGTYDVVVTENGCSSDASVIVNEVILPIIQLGPDVNICADEAVTFTIAEPASWSTGIFGDQLTVSQSGTYLATYQDGACSVTDSVHVVVMPLPELNLPASAIGCLDEPLTLYAYEPENYYYVWSNGATSDQITVTEFDDYTVTAGNNCGVVSATVSVSFEDCTYSLFIPNSFTPDKDGVNDVWKIGSFNITKMEILIFDRWGLPVFKSDSPEFVWTGDVLGGEYYAGDGLYFFQMEFETADGITGNRDGHIILIR